MVLGCFMCRRPLLPILDLQKKSKSSNKYPLIQVPGKGLNNLPLRNGPPGSWGWGNGKSVRSIGGGGPYPDNVKEFQKELLQPMTTKCGHIFHRGCLKEYSLQLANRPAAHGNPVVCPICSKGFVYAHCFNVYLDAIPDPTKDTSDRYIRLLDLQDENVEIKRTILRQRLEVEKNSKALKEIQERIQAVGQEILTKGDDLTQFKKYTIRVGSLDGLVDRLSNSRENYKNLKSQNAQLYRLVRNQMKAQRNSNMESEVLEHISSVQKYTVPKDLLDEFDEAELADELNSSSSNDNIDNRPPSTSYEEHPLISQMLAKILPPPENGQIFKPKASDIANKNQTDTLIYQVRHEDWRNRNDRDKSKIGFKNHRRTIQSQTLEPIIESSRTQYLYNHLQRQSKTISNVTKTNQAKETHTQTKSFKSRKHRHKIKDEYLNKTHKINNNIIIKHKNTNYEAQEFVSKEPSTEDEITILLEDPELDLSLDEEQEEERRKESWQDEREECGFSAKDYECLRLK